MRTSRSFLVALVVGTSIAAFGVPSSAGGDRPRCFGKPATHVFASDVHDAQGTGRDDVIVSGAFITHGRGGDDLICGRSGHGQDLYGDSGNDRINGRGGRDGIQGGGGNDLGKGGAGNDSIAGRAGNDKLLGNAGRDRASGGGGQDTCKAEEESQCEN